jgi:cytochrome o ubiquinol oxidase subunit 2
MKDKDKIGLIALIFFASVLCTGLFVYGNNIAVLNPKGLIANRERHLMITALLLMLIVVVPVYIMTFAIAWRYRAGNKKAKYTPNWDRHLGAELTWWGVPLVIVSILAVITWQSSHELDPFNRIASDKRPLVVQVVALDWKWLFIYPDQQVASVNFLEMPVNRPVNFEITSDAPMNSFWIPQLGGQIYAMAGMKSQLHLMADTPGTYNGVSANISGRGFADMKFTALASSDEGFDEWVSAAKASPDKLNIDQYNKLAKPSEKDPVKYYSLAEPFLFQEVIDKYMMPDNPAGLGVR